MNSPTLKRLVVPSIGVLVVLAILWWMFIWLTGLPDSERTNDIAVLTALSTAAAAIAAFLSFFAASASRDSARASKEVADRALRAVVLHNRPTGFYRSVCKYDRPGEWLGPVVFSAGQSLSTLADDEVQIWIEIKCVSPVTAVQFSYVTPDGEHPPVAVTPKELRTLPGVKPIATEPGPHTGITPVNVDRWTLTCRDTETHTLWRAQGVTENGDLFHDDMVHEVEFDLVPEPAD